MKFYKFIQVTFILICISFLIKANTDSLLTILNNTEDDSLKIEIWYTLSKKFNTNNPELALKYADNIINTAKKINNSEKLAVGYNLKGIVYDYSGKFDLALDLYFKALKINEKNKDTAAIAKNLNNIGIVYDYRGNKEKALDYYRKSIKIKRQLDDIKGIAYTKINIALIYLAMNKEYKSQKTATEAINSLKSINDSISIAAVYNNLGVIYGQRGEMYKAKSFFLKSYKIKKALKNIKGLVAVLNNIAECNAHLDLFKESLAYIDSSLYLCRKHNLKEDIKQAYKTYSEVYEQMGDYERALYFNKIATRYQDTIYSTKSSQMIAEMETKYKVEKKEQQIELQNTKLKKKEAENRVQRYLIYLAVTFIVAVLGILILLIRMFRQKKKANILLTEQKHQIEEKNEELNQQNEEISAQRDKIQEQRDIVTNQKKELTDSIHYANKIQSAVIPNDSYISNILKKYFVIYKPRDIVSGDFYWVGKQNENIIVIVADCTGHGVPGAFMSMLGVAFINDIIRGSSKLKPAEILNRLREKIIEALNQQIDKDDIKKSLSVKDGMDMAAVIINKNDGKIYYSGANNPLYLIKSDEFIETKADKMPVSIHLSMNFFTNHEFDILPGDSFYIFSDGFADQFGGPKGKKLKYKKFKKLICDNHNKSMNEQKQILEKTYYDWKQDYEQVDDILVMGIKID